jgi:hypothetical protein
MSDSKTGSAKTKTAAMVSDHAGASDVNGMGNDEIRDTFGESLESILDISKWKQDENLAEVYKRISREIEQSLEDEAATTKAIREVIFAKITESSEIPDLAGVYLQPVERIAEAHRNVLFNGLVEACDGTIVPFDTLPITITQTTVCLVSYAGQQGSWTQRLFQRDFRGKEADVVDRMFKVLDARQKRAAVEYEDKSDEMSMLMRRGVMTYAERAILLNESKAPWRMGQGNPAPYELLSGSGRTEIVVASLPVLQKLVDHGKFVFVPSTIKDRVLLSIGQALRPMEYLIYNSARQHLKKIVGGHFDTEMRSKVSEYIEDYGSQIVIGMYRVARHSPAQVFYAHKNHIHEAVLIAMADSVMQEHRGFPMLLDLADHACRAVFGTDVFMGATQLAFASAGEPFRYMSERSTRN